MSTLVTDEMLDALTVRGRPHEIAPLVRERFGDLADRVAFYMPYRVTPEVVAAVVEGFGPRAGRSPISV